MIIHRNRIADLAAERVYFAPHIEVLEPDHPERPFVAAPCLYSRAVDTGEADCAIDDHEDAERFARALLMPAEAFAPVTARSDTELAELYAAPRDQVAIRRHEAGAKPAPLRPNERGGAAPRESRHSRLRGWLPSRSTRQPAPRGPRDAACA
jgi:hypothetical protein